MGNPDTPPGPVKIDTVGVYAITAADYHRDPVRHRGGSLSSTGARRILPPSCPALFRDALVNGQKHRPVFDIGHAAHAIVLGVGPPLAIIDTSDWRTKAARAARDKAYAENRIPVLRDEYDTVHRMADRLRDHPEAGPILAAANAAEQTLIWKDSETGVWCRAMLDLTATLNGQLIIGDYKTTTDAHPDALARTMEKYGYHQQGAWYQDGATTLDLAGDGRTPDFWNIYQEKTSPYLVVVAQPDDDAMAWGRILNRKALHVYRECSASGRWPGHATTRIALSLPPWALRRNADAWELGDYDPHPDW